LFKKLSESSLIQVPITLIVYTFYGLVLGGSLYLSAIFLTFAFRRFGTSLTGGSGLSLYSDLLFLCLSAGLAFFLFYITGVILMGFLIRIMSLGVRPGSYEIASPTVFRWLIYSGIYTMATQLILPMIPISFFSLLFFRIIGCRIGRNVRLNSFMLNDAYLLEIGDNVTIGGQTDISCHLFENNKLILMPIKIGSETLIGAHCYISPGVTIGKRCTIGLNSYIRRGKTIKDDTKLTSVAAVHFSTAGTLEKMHPPEKKG